jgi:hypothetical protein
MSCFRWLNPSPVLTGYKTRHPFGAQATPQSPSPSFCSHHYPKMKYTAAALSALALAPAALAQSSTSSAAAPSGSGNSSTAGGDFQAYLQQVLGALT